MVLHKRLDYGFNGFQVPAIPRASRSARTRRSCSKKAKDNQMYAFDLLATVAGELLVLKESSPDNELPGRAQFVAAKDTVKQEQLDEEKPFKHDPCDQRSCDESASATRAASSTHLPDFALKGYPHAQEDVSSTPVSIKLESGRSDKLVHVDESIIEKSEGEPIHGKYYSERGLPGFAESHDGELEDEIARQLEVGQRKIGGGIKGVSLDMCISEDPMELDIKPPVYVSSEGSVEVPLCGDHISGGLLPRCEDDVKVDGRDDDEYFSWCNQPSTISNKSFRPPHLGNRRIRKMLASKFRSVAPKFKDGKLSDTDMELKSIFCSRHSCYTRRRTWKCSPFKRRKLFERNSISMSEGRVRREAGPNSPGKGDNGEAAGSASEASSPVAGQESSLKCKDSCVKLRIKSFKIPELFIEIPETATVGSLKRTVVEAVTTIIGGGLRVGVLLQGKKVRDDNKTLLQTGISHDDRLDALGFMLEPINSCGPPSICPEDTPHLLLPCGASQPPTRYPVVPSSNPVVPDASQDPSPIDADNCVQSDHDSGPSTDISSEKTTPNSRALVSMPSMSVEALAVVPLPQKPRRSELVQRRIRRPFSVSEVEALVQAVEKLGTGRWRDVKLRAFDNAKHRTYVDLKDKWKTLVHTARISPRQRRGEPVPQELLDRVLSAHAYWSQQQAKQHGKLPTEPSLLL